MTWCSPRDGRTLACSNRHDDNGVSVIDTDKQEVKGKYLFHPCILIRLPAVRPMHWLFLLMKIVYTSPMLTTTVWPCLMCVNRDMARAQVSCLRVGTQHPWKCLWQTVDYQRQRRIVIGQSHRTKSVQRFETGRIYRHPFKGSLSVLMNPLRESWPFTRPPRCRIALTRPPAHTVGRWRRQPIPRKVGDVSPIKHVFYIIKENRTYDRVLMTCLPATEILRCVCSPEKITPNQHAPQGLCVAG